MKNWGLGLLALALALLALGCQRHEATAPAERTAGGRDYYTAGSDPRASDTNAGTLRAPFKTIARGVAALQPGDTLWVRRGVYRERVAVAKSGTGPERRIAIRAMPGETVVVKGAELLTGWTRTAAETNRPIWETEWRWPSVAPSMIACDEEPLMPLWVPPATEAKKPPAEYCQYFIGYGRGQAAMFPGSFFFDETRNRLLVWLKDGGDPNRHAMEAAVRGAFWGTGKYILVEGITFKYAPLHVPVGGMVFCLTGPTPPGGADGDGNIVRRCDISLGAFEGMVVRGGREETTLVEDCVVHHNGCSAGTFDGQGLPHTRSWLHIRRCRFTDNNLFYWNPAWYAGCKHYGRRVFFEECEFARNYRSPNLWFDIHQRDCIVHRCYSHAPGQFGLYYEIGETGAFINNVVEGAEDCAAIALNGSSRTLIAHNAVLARERGIIIGWEGNAEGQVSRINCHNSVFNNIVLTTGLPALLLAPDSIAATGNVSDCNLFWVDTPFAAPWQQALWRLWESRLGGPMDLATWRQTRHMDIASRVVEPRVTVSNGRLRRLAGSPTLAGGRRLTRAVLEEIFAVKPMPAITAETVSSSVREHEPASPAFLDKVAELLRVPEDRDVPLGPLP